MIDNGLTKRMVYRLESELQKIRETMDNSMIATCGMNCEICMAHLREKKKCNGCNNDDKDKPFHCTKCVIKHCEIKQQLNFNFCYDCPKYPCTRLKQLDKRYRTKYKMSMLDNLAKIKEIGPDNFVQAENERWTCDCGGIICVHKGCCSICGKERVEKGD